MCERERERGQKGITHPHRRQLLLLLLLLLSLMAEAHFIFHLRTQTKKRKRQNTGQQSVSQWNTLSSIGNILRKKAANAGVQAMKSKNRNNGSGDDWATKEEKGERESYWQICQQPSLPTTIFAFCKLLFPITLSVPSFLFCFFLSRSKSISVSYHVQLLLKRQ